MERPLALFKGGEAVHMEQLLKQGIVYMNTIDCFRRMDREADAAMMRADGFEGSSYCANVDGGYMEMWHDGDWIELGSLVGGITVFDEQLGPSNIYSLHAKTASHYNEPFRLDTLAFEAYVFFRDADEFLRRVRRAADKVGQHIEAHMVRYVDRKTFNGPMGAFTKFSEHSHQSEARIIARPGIGRPFILSLGDLSDIAIPVDADGTFRIAPGEDQGTVIQVARK